ncbi:MAG: 30S ribosomal protein S21 [Bacilli bacterium]
MIQVAVKNGNLDMALKKFKQNVARAGLPTECKKREAYAKPGVKRREAKKEGIKNARKKSKMNKDY